MNEHLIRAATRAEFPTRERVYITERLNEAAVPEVSLASARVAPGVTTELHSLAVREYYLVESGHGLMEVGGGPAFGIGPGDTVVIPAGVSQRVTNVGDTDLRFQCLCLPRFTAAGYTALE